MSCQAFSWTDRLNILSHASAFDFRFHRHTPDVSVGSHSSVLGLHLKPCFLGVHLCLWCIHVSLCIKQTVRWITFIWFSLQVHQLPVIIDRGCDRMILLNVEADSQNHALVEFNYFHVFIRISRHLVAFQRHDKKYSCRYMHSCIHSLNAKEFQS